LDGFVSAVATTERDDAAVAATRAAIATLREATLPIAFEHGDASHPNLFLRDDDSVAAVDWERAEPDGLPVHDLTTLLAYVAVARSGATGPADQGRAIAAALAETGGSASAAIRGYLDRIGVDPDLARPLTLVALARLTMGLVQRLGDGSADTPSAETVDFVRAHRYYVAWRTFAALVGRRA
jgi:aminoglycoside phosphotransferase (APT) family kinase protein